MSLTDRIDRVLAGLAAERRRLSRAQREEQVARGAREELREHAKTIRRVKRNPKMPAREVAESIAREHVRKDPLHYVKAEAVKQASKATKPQRGLKSPRIRLLGRRGRLRIYLVDATAVRKLTHLNPNAPDFTMGTGDQVWENVTGPWEIWISDELGPLERQLTWLHEATERRLMKRHGLSYDEAHEKALAVEDKYRKANGRGLAAALRRERGQ